MDLKFKPPVQYNKQYHRRVLLSSFQLSGHTTGFRTQTQKIELLYKITRVHPAFQNWICHAGYRTNFPRYLLS